MKKFNTALDFWDNSVSIRIYPYMTAQEFAKLSPEMKQSLVGKKPS